MTNIKYSKRFKLRNGEKVDFCPEFEAEKHLKEDYEYLTGE